MLRALVGSALPAPVCALAGPGLGVLIRHAAATMAAAVFTLLMLPTVFAESARWSAYVNHAGVPAAWKRLVQYWEADPAAGGALAADRRGPRRDRGAAARRVKPAARRPIR
ncbi:hypothetical protein [Streptomyces sp. A0592]|uniref:hypothetical protein n=1 Tax=Streptomyces sp. A0592 TaxID=2563099 RepID=UPI00109EDEBC|nr:hypothetical protein [Streptomyces sp. A0592]THA86912.1 hypothetical protein E6U81_02205 [Streptomyces sp. A0592]